MPAMPREGDGHGGKALIEIQPVQIGVKTGSDPDGNYVIGLDIESQVGVYRIVLPFIDYLAFAAKVLEGVSVSIKEQRKGR